MLALPSDRVVYTEDWWLILEYRGIVHDDPVQRRYHTLLAALGDGWTVEAPVYVRSDWSLKRTDNKAFYFPLRRDSIGKTMQTLLGVPDCEAVRRLISDHGWALSPNGEA